MPVGYSGLVGYGRLEMRDGSFYEGEFIDGEIDGRGTLHSQTRDDDYTGEFVRGDKHGHGTLTQKDGTTYEGEWFHNKFQGKVRTSIVCFSRSVALAKLAFSKHEIRIGAI